MASLISHLCTSWHRDLLGAWGDADINRVLKKIPKRFQDPVLWVWLAYCFNPKRSIPKSHIK